MSLFDVQTWLATAQYYKHDVVWGGDSLPYFYYALKDHVSSSDLATDIAAGNWDGAIQTGGAAYPHFFWLPSFGLNGKVQPRVKIVKFGDGYEQRTPDGINTNLLEFDYLFENRSLMEATAILHFLFTQAAVTTFLHTPIAPYDKQKKFVCRSWDHTHGFIDTLTIRAKFEEVSV